jgi:hypothetical protein
VIGRRVKTGRITKKKLTKAYKRMKHKAKGGKHREKQGGKPICV